MNMTIRLALTLGAALAAGVLAPASQAAAGAPKVAWTLQTEASASGVVDAAVLARDAADPSASRFVGTAGLGGLELYDLSGKRVGATAAGQVAAVAVAYGVPFGGQAGTLLAAIDTTTNSLRLFRFQAGALQEVGARALPLGFAAEGLCLFRNPLDDALYAFIVGDGGEIDQQVLFATAEGKLDARQVRRISVPSPVKQCQADRHGHVYASEETVGIWRFNADPEADVSATVVDAPRLGKIDEESGGIAVLDGGPGRNWLIASNTSAGTINIYDRDKDDAFLGSVQVASATAELGEPGRLFADATGLTGDATGGFVLVTDDDSASYKLLAVQDLADAVKIPAAAATDEAAAPKVVTVTARVESVAVGSYGDAADDPAIWVDPVNPGNSLVVATDKKAGLYVYDMAGEVVQFLADGKMNNVDLREDFKLAGKKVVLVAASNRTDKSIALYRLDTQSRQLVDVADGMQSTGMADPYGLCMYRAADGRTYVFVNGDDTLKRQWELVATPTGRVRAKLVREMKFDSQTEGCVADDATGNLYVDEEGVAMWRMSAAPKGGNAKTAISRVDGNPGIKDDLEGLGMYDLGNGRGYFVLSSQGNDRYAVFRREGKQEYLGSFAVVADPLRGIDGISETDGLEVTSRNLGPGFEHGAMIAQDGRNVMPVENQNYKYVPWQSIAEALGLEMR